MALDRPAHIAFDLDVSDHIDRCGIESKDEIPLSRRIAKVIASDHDGQLTFFCRADYKDCERSILLAIVPHHTPEQDHRSALVFFIDIGWNEAIGRFVAHAYHLSQSEQDILELFILGTNLEQIAAIRRRLYKTVRTQFYAALNKCGMSSRVDLVREIVTRAMFQSLVPKVANAAKHPHRCELHLLRPGGRTLKVIVSGDVQGTPVFMLASAGPQKFAPKKPSSSRRRGFASMQSHRLGWDIQTRSRKARAGRRGPDRSRGEGSGQCSVRDGERIDDLNCDAQSGHAVLYPRLGHPRDPQDGEVSGEV